MSLNSCSSCAVVLNQQQEENICHQNQLQDEPESHSEGDVKHYTVVENGRVVVKPLQPQPQDNTP